MIGITFAILLLMASIEAGLAYMREVLLRTSWRPTPCCEATLRARS